jgi:plasmid maintenance system antidote protein VapI
MSEVEMSSEIKVVYTIPELARMLRISRFRVARLLKASNVQTRRSGRSILVFLSEIKKALPELWESMQEQADLD